MQEEQQRRIKSMYRIKMFLKDFGPPAPEFTPPARRVDAAIVRLEALAVEQHTARLGLPANGAQTRRLADLIREDRMLRISREGKRLLKFAPGAEAALRVPEKRSSPATICDAAERMAKLVRPHATLFYERGFPRDFITGLGKATREVRALLKSAGEGRRRHAKATAALAAEIREARAEERLIDALLQPYLRTNGPMRRAWEKCKRVGPKLGRPRKPRRREG